jgi:mono/diheme cytochrome c family protein
MPSNWAMTLLDHPDAAMRSAVLRLLNDSSANAGSLGERLVRLGRTEPDAGVRSELAGTATRLETDAALAVLSELIGRREDVSDKHIPLRIWWTLEDQITRDADAVVSWIQTGGLWEAPLFTEHLAGRVARRLAAHRGDNQSYTRVDPDKNWNEYARHPRSPMPGGKGDDTEWETNYTPEISDRNLTRLARLLEMAPPTHRDRLLGGVAAGLEQGIAPARVPAPLLAVINRWWSDQPHTEALVDVAVHLRHPEAVKQAIAAAGDPRRGAGRPATRGSSADERGKQAFLTHCAPCHQTDGGGMARLAAPLRNSKWVLGREDALARIVLNGLAGELLMPPMATLDDQQLAEILTYIRRAWGNEAGPVSSDILRTARAESMGRTTPWTAGELSALGTRK